MRTPNRLSEKDGLQSAIAAAAAAPAGFAVRASLNRPKALEKRRPDPAPAPA